MFCSIKKVKSAAIPGILLALALTAFPALATAEFPNRPITLIVPYPAGGGSDNVARLVAAKLSEKLGQSVVVENKAGAGGNIGTRLITQAKPDGYTLGLATPGPVTVGKSLYNNLPYDPQKELEPVIFLNQSPIVMLVNSKLPVTSLATFNEWVKTQPQGANAAIGGTGSLNHLVTELYLYETKAPIVGVPYKGGSEAVIDTMAGHVDLLFIPLSAVISSIQAKQLKPLFIASETRNQLFPEIPTSKEVGLSNIIGSAWNGLVVPAGTPAAVIEKLNSTLNTILKQEDVQEAFTKQGMTTMGGSAEDFKKFLHDDAQKWQAVITNAHIEKI